MNLIRLHRPRRAAAAALAATALAACQTVEPPRAARVVAVEEERRGWETVVNAADSARLGSIGELWSGAMAAARAAGFARRLRGEGALLDLSTAQAWAVPSPGSYRCRLFRLGREGPRRGLQLSGPFFCHIGDEGEQLSLTQQTGPERPGGYLWRNGERQMVFVGALSRGRERVPPSYGRTPERDVVGVLERVGPFRYRLVMPRAGGLLDVLELVPALPGS